MPKTREQNLADVKASNQRKYDKGMIRQVVWIYPEDKQRILKYGKTLQNLREATDRVPLDTLLKPHRMRAAREEAQFRREQKAKEEAEKARGTPPERP